MRRAAPALLLLGAAGGATLVAYVAIRPALFIAILSAMALAGFYRCLATDTRRQLGRAPVVLAIGLPLLAWVLPGAWLLYAAMVAVVPLLARRRGEVAPIYLFALLLLPALEQTFTIGGLKLFDVGVHSALALGAAGGLVLRPGAPRVPAALDAPLVALMLLLIVANARDTSATNFLRVAVNTLFLCGLPYFIVSRSVRSMDDVRLCLVYLAGAAAVLSMILLYEARSAWPMYNVLYDRHGIAMQIMVKARGGVMRAGGPFVESTSMAMVLATCILAAWLSRPAFRSGPHHAAVLALLLAGLVAPQSRGAWIGLLLATIAADLYRRRPGAAVRRLGMVALAGVALLAAAPFSAFLSETLGLTGGSVDTVDYRQRLFDRGVEEFLRSPITGYSAPDLLIRLADLRQGEGIVDFVNTYIYFALIGGAIGLAVFVGAFAAYLLHLWRCRPRGGPDADAMAAVFAGLVMPMEMLVFTSFGGRPEMFVFVFFALATAIAARHAAERRRRWRLQRQPAIA
ncbi:O-antigen ligase family protein [Sphingomonas corticis]|jgi:O-antigen ligase|uniref:O-antigen ligase domain-containing protein n=1 Tax=Sphingomonas corticis TaxID=2722791 RepID=A0ABX1CIY9_9SPHN|nr:O-antigen ligase family protein [Sphingomonas corticis]NJR77959.1 O-antigen ligase domain-containing protein [Sphingomonas corticis]